MTTPLEPNNEGQPPQHQEVEKPRQEPTEQSGKSWSRIITEVAAGLASVAVIAGAVKAVIELFT